MLTNQKGIAHLFVLIILLAGIGVGVYLVQFTQVFKPQASSIKIQSSPSPEVNNYQQLLEEDMIEPIGRILEINFSYDIKKSPTLSINGISKKNGYAPSASSDQGNYALIVRDKNQTEIYRTNFILPNHLVNPPPLPGEEAAVEAVAELPAVKFTVTIPYLPNGSSLQVLDPQNQLILNQSLEIYIPQTNNQPDFKSIPGSEFIPDKQTLLNRMFNFFIPRVYASPDGFLNIAIISQGYTDFNQFHNDINEIMTHALTYEPFKKRASQILVSYIDNTANLGCRRYPGIDRILYCDDQLVTQRVNSAGVPYDYIHVLVNDPNYGGSGGPISAGYNGLYKGETAVHELLGHSFGGLLDEYTSDQEGNFDNQIHGLYDDNGNCYAGPPPVPSWNSLVNPQDYNQGCKYSNWYRSSTSSIMMSFLDKYFNPVSQAVLDRRLDAVAGPFASASPSPPTIAVVCSVSPNQINIGGSATWRVDAEGGVRPYSISWDGTDGLHSIGDTGQTNTAAVTYTLAGTKTCLVRVRDQANGEVFKNCPSLTVIGSSSSPTPTPQPSVTPTPTPAGTLTVKGTVYRDFNGNGVLDSGDKEYADSPVYLHNPDGSQVLAQFRTTGGGNFSFYNLTPGTYRVTHYVPPGFSKTTDDSFSFDLSSDKIVYFGIKPNI